MTPHPVDLEALTAEAKEHMRYGFRSRVLDLIAEVRAARQAEWPKWLENAASALKDASTALLAAGYKKASSDAYGAGLIALAFSRPAALASPSVPPPQTPPPIVGLPPSPLSESERYARDASSRPTDAPPVLEEKAAPIGPRCCDLWTVGRGHRSGCPGEKAAREAGEETAALKEGGEAGVCCQKCLQDVCVCREVMPPQTTKRDSTLQAGAVSQQPGTAPALCEVCLRPWWTEATADDDIDDSSCCASGPEYRDSVCYRLGYDRLRGAPPKAPAALPKEEVAPPCDAFKAHSASIDRLDVPLQAWPIPDVLERLADAADHLRGDHNCDAHGHEGVLYAAQAARAHAKSLRAAPVPLPEEQLPEEGLADADADMPPGHVVTETQRGVRGGYLPEFLSAAAPAPGDADEAHRIAHVVLHHWQEPEILKVLARVRSEEIEACALLVESGLRQWMIDGWVKAGRAARAIRARASDATSAGGGE